MAVVVTGLEAHVGEMIVALAIEPAEGIYEWSDGALEWGEPGDENVHLGVSARGATDNRFITGLEVHVRVIDADDQTRADAKLPMLWHPRLYHYGSNFTLPTGNPVTVEIQIDAAEFPRHDEKSGMRHTENLFVRFEDVELAGG